jgi:excisionase family DNA binding protein
VSEQKPYLTVAEVAELVGLSKPTIYSAIADGKLRAWRPWSRGDRRILREDLDAWMKHTSADTNGVA